MCDACLEIDQNFYQAREAAIFLENYFTKILNREELLDMSFRSLCDNFEKDHNVIITILNSMLQKKGAVLQ